MSDTSDWSPLVTVIVAATSNVSDWSPVVTVVVAGGTAPVITTEELPDGQVGVAYDEDIAYSYPSGGPVTMSVTGLPPGLSADSVGRITGTPGASGTYSPRVVPTGDGDNVGDAKRIVLRISGTAIAVQTSPWDSILAGVTGVK